MLSNIKNPEIDRINIIIEHADLDLLQTFLLNLQENDLNKITITLFRKRPTFNDYFKLTERYPEDINIISNKDIIMDEISLKKMKEWDWKNYCMALSRWDFTNKSMNTETAVHFNRADSQDTWILKGSFPQITDFNYGLGVAGVDNSVAHYLSEKYDVINPSLDIKTFHYHLAKSRNYKNWRGKVVERVPLPYKMLESTYLP